MTDVAVGSTGTLTVVDDFGGLSDVGGSRPAVWSTDDGDASYLRWVTPTLTGDARQTRVDWTPAPMSAASVALRVVVKHPAALVLSTAPFLSALIWKSDLSDLVVLTGLPNIPTPGGGWVTLTSDAHTGRALGWLAAGTALVRLQFAQSSGAVGVAAGDETWFTQIAFEVASAVRPGVRQRQIPGQVRQRQIGLPPRQRQDGR